MAIRCAERKFRGALTSTSTPSTRRLLDGSTHWLIATLAMTIPCVATISLRVITSGASLILANLLPPRVKSSLRHLNKSLWKQGLRRHSSYKATYRSYCAGVMSFLNGFCSRYLRAAGVDASVACARSEGFWTTPRRALLIGQRSSPLLGRSSHSCHRACKCTVTTHQWSRTRRRTPAAAPSPNLHALGPSRTSCPCTCGRSP